jgi:toluene monooxygenase system ferredoxin subunit
MEVPPCRVASLAELCDGELRACVVDGTRLVLARVGDVVSAFADRCPHQGMPLSDGTLDGRVLTCSGHSYQFDATTGGGINPRTMCLRAYAVTLAGDDVLVDVP